MPQSDESLPAEPFLLQGIAKMQTHSARMVRSLLCLISGVLLVSSFLQGQSRPIPAEIDQIERTLTEARAANNTRQVGADLIALGYLYRQAGKMQKSLAYLNEALSIEQSLHSPAGQVSALSLLGRVYTDLGQEEKAIELLNQALSLCGSETMRSREAEVLNNRGRAYNNLGRRDEALEDLNRAMSIWHEIDQTGEGAPPARRSSGIGGARSAEASTLDNLGRTYNDMGQGKRAVEYFDQALALWRAEGEQNGEALSLNNEGRAFADLGEKEKALDAYSRALALWRATGNRQGEGSTLNNLGRLYRDLGQNQAALDYFNQSLPIWREVENRNGEALALNDIGRVNSDMGDGKKALEYFDQALPIWRETGNRRGEATTLTNEGRAWLRLDPAKALNIDTQALAIWKEVKDRRGEALALSSIAWAAAAQKNPDKALASRLAALALAKEAGDPELEGGIETSLMLGFRAQNHPQEAIFFGTDAVNSYQQIRRNISGLDKDLQTEFAQSKSSTYRVLAELLVQTDRLAEAEQVLDLLKEAELNEVVRGAEQDSAAKTAVLALTPTQQKAEADLAAQEKSASSLVDLAAEYAALQGKTSRTSEETARIKDLESKIEAGNAEVNDFFRKTLYPELAQRSSTQDANAILSQEKSAISKLQNTLADIGPHVLGIRLLMGDEHVYALVVTAQARKRFELPASSSEIRSKVLQVRDDLRHPSSDPRPHLAELYAMIVGPLSAELDSLARSSAAGPAPTLLWSLDGVLRYLPMGALYDGHQYLVERFNNVLFTPESYGHMSATEDKNALHVLALGLSKSYGGLPALPGVLPELDAVAHDPSVAESHGPMDGHLLPNDLFTYAAMKTELTNGSTYSVIHIASHFVLETGEGREPYLMLGGDAAANPEGFPLTLSRLEDSTISFHGTRLLTLSACSTAKGDVAGDGLEIDSLGMVAQRKDAEAVLATLWDVNDASTSRLMSDFYSRWVKHPEQGKGEALREAQLAFLRGSSADASSAAHRGVQAEGYQTAGQGARTYAHPFYWAPFVLTGNYR